MNEGKSAIILPFPVTRLVRKRGRPKSAPQGKDLGTPELIRKRLAGDTAEALDLCMERGLITPEQHWCGIHLRWLYTLRFGAPSVRAIDPSHFGGREIAMNDPDWRASREQEYQECIRLLAKRGCATLVLDVCVHDKRPGFLDNTKPLAKRYPKLALHSLQQLQEGLSLLVDEWIQKGKSKN